MSNKAYAELAKKYGETSVYNALLNVAGDYYELYKQGKDISGKPLSSSVPTQSTAIPSNETPPVTASPNAEASAAYSKWLQKNGIDTQKSYVDALRAIDTAEMQNKSTYGAKAESLGQAGLSDSGYAARIDDATDAAITTAKKEAAESKIEADKEVYQAFLDEQNKLFSGLVSSVINEDGTFNDVANVKSNLIEAGYTTAQVNAALSKLSGEYATSLTNSIEKAQSVSDIATDESLQALVSAGILDQGTVNGIKQQAKNKRHELNATVGNVLASADEAISYLKKINPERYTDEYIASANFDAASEVINVCTELYSNDQMNKDDYLAILKKDIDGALSQNANNKVQGVGELLARIEEGVYGTEGVKEDIKSYLREKIEGNPAIKTRPFDFGVLTIDGIPVCRTNKIGMSSESLGIQDGNEGEIKKWRYGHYIIFSKGKWYGTINYGGGADGVTVTGTQALALLDLLSE